jgi:hypothetical protein
MADGKIVILAQLKGLPGNAIKLSYNSGLIGFPQQTLDGIDFECLMNPAILPGSIVQIDNSLILQFQQSTSYAAVQYAPAITSDGFYRIYWLERSGDTRGEDWTNHCIAVGINEQPPITSPYVETIG